MAKLCDECETKQARMFSKSSRLSKVCGRCKNTYSTREYETYCDECSDEYIICRDCGKEMGD